MLSFIRSCQLSYAHMFICVTFLYMSMSGYYSIYLFVFYAFACLVVPLLSLLLLLHVSIYHYFSYREDFSLIPSDKRYMSSSVIVIHALPEKHACILSELFSIRLFSFSEAIPNVPVVTGTTVTLQYFHDLITSFFKSLKLSIFSTSFMSSLVLKGHATSIMWQPLFLSCSTISGLLFSRW